ncbi:MAG: zinc finger Ran-binding domain-containing protein [Chloroflexi bacterium]|nr:zinc finger Ran-binding domain-containing protein [Chloroflexota bacterium]MCI0580617.1 zinc finger Ran-binding domain-containing protein [Chloroflexota bacterium]MCI0649719.1 zinc finger Ran-binding domain-containing protein [Chloroflexota bacterium]MCI0727767.1 zinc finger Ran-binding domain-containing protein [Chloroflexota bacterium]
MAIREGRWDCQYCGTTAILGRHRECTNCGRSRPEGTKFYLAGDEPAAADKLQEQQAKIGPDWICAFCSSSNPSDVVVCQSCSAPREDSSAQQQVRDYKPGEAPRSGDMDLDAPMPLPARPVASTAKSKKGAFALAGAGVAGFFFLCLCLLAAVLLLGGRDVEATISGFTWERTLAVEAYRTVTEEDWSLPAGGRITSQRQEIHHYNQVLDHYESRERQVSEQVQVGQRTYVCGQRDLGNGYFEDIECTEPVYETEYRTETYEEPIYRQEPVYQTWYTYEIDKWVVDRTEEAAGEDRSPVWPEATLAKNEREGQRTETYTIFFTGEEGKSYSQELSFDEWGSFEMGQHVTLKLNVTGEVEEIEP